MFHSERTLSIQEEKASNLGATLRRLAGYFRPYLAVVLIVGVLTIAGTYMQVLVPDLTGQIVDCYLTPYVAGSSAAEATGQPQADNLAIPEISVEESSAAVNCWFGEPDPTATAEETIAGLGVMVLIITALFIGNALLTAVSFYGLRWAGFRVLRDLRAEVFHHIQTLSLGYFSEQETGDVMSRFTNDMSTLQQAIAFAVLNVLSGFLLIFMIIWQMFSKSVPYALISLVTLPLMFIATRWFSGQARKAFRQAQQEIGSVNADLQEGIAAVREVQAFSREDENIEQFRISNAANRDANIKAQAYTSALAPTLEAFGYASLAIVAVVGGLLLLGGGTLFGTTVSLGLIITFIGYTQQFNNPVQQISVLWTNLQSAIAGTERIFGLLDVEADIQEKPDAVELPTVEGRVIYEDVWAEYKSGEPVLRGINITAEPGKTIAIVGPTGAGKTTIINLLPRFWDVSDGRITIDGYDVRDVTLRSLREQIGLVLQDTFLFGDTVMNNIRYGRPDATDEEVIAAAKIAHADQFITRLEDGYETMLGERGGGLSQGQRQLLAIARVALTDPRILILDEATSSVDTRTERQIQSALDDLLRGRTSFVIAHRLSTIRNADELLVLKDGQIIERGTHKELLAAKSFYHKLYMSQFRREVDVSEDEIEEVDAFFAPAD
ncbi:MAG: ABC transporter ATP-binding protein [Candidatus Promineifilaceae bacterium]